jgi:hypothetical protein
MREMLVGYDDNLLPDGKVIGDVEHGKYEPYSDEEKEKFRSNHNAEIKGRREQAMLMLMRDE